MLSVADPGSGSDAAAPLLQLDGFEGPLDLLLELARAQKVDLARISILRLVEQYLAVVETRRELRQELAADWLVMAAWLTWLKSRLLLPQEPGAPEPGEAAAELLAARLAELAHVGRGAAWLERRDRLGHAVFARGAAEILTEIDRSGLALDLTQLLGGYLAAMRRTARRSRYRPEPPAFWTMRHALARLRLLLGEAAAEWCTLQRFLPEWMQAHASAHESAHAGEQARRAALAGTLLAGLELARSGVVELHQERQFGDILLRRSLSPPAAEAVRQEAAE